MSNDRTEFNDGDTTDPAPRVRWIHYALALLLLLASLTTTALFMSERDRRDLRAQIEQMRAQHYKLAKQNFELTNELSHARYDAQKDKRNSQPAVGPGNP
ncbi:MAG: hypothetical protein EXS05_02265 [Planctomycetaceae bacterium]|nr:hypothetical protein [Planctomycetaceae bacterium]